MTLSAKTSSESATVISQVMYSEHANIFQDVHGGDLLKLMDTSAGICASRHQDGPVNTKALGGIVFHAPAPLNCLCTCKAHVTYTSERVIEIYTELSYVTLPWEDEQLCLSGYSYYVGVDLKARKALPAVPLKITTPEEKAEFEAGRLRMKYNLQITQAGKGNLFDQSSERK